MGWKQWSKEWIYGTLGLFNGYRVGRQSFPKAPQHDTSHKPCPRSKQESPLQENRMVGLMRRGPETDLRFS
jgi:hypothetical protein